MGVPDTGIDDSNLGALAQNTGSMQLVDTRHVVDIIADGRRILAEGRQRRAGRQLVLSSLPRLFDRLKRLQRVDVLDIGLDSRAGKDVTLEYPKHLCAALIGDIVGNGGGISSLDGVSGCCLGYEART